MRRPTHMILAMLAAALLLPRVQASSDTPAAPAGEDLLGTITGTVRDSPTHDPVPNASVYIVELRSTRLTDSGGRFAFRDVPYGAYTLEIQHVAYLTAQRSVVLGPQTDDAAVSFGVIPRAYVVDEVAITSPRVTPLTSAKGSRYALPYAVLDQFPLDRLEDAIELVPGVTVSGGRPFFRGIGFEHVLPLINGIPAREPIKGSWILPPPQAVNTGSTCRATSALSTDRPLLASCSSDWQKAVTRRWPASDTAPTGWR